MPDEVATFAKLLVSDAGKMIDGELLHIAGGRGTFDIRQNISNRALDDNQEAGAYGVV